MIGSDVRYCDRGDSDNQSENLSEVVEKLCRGVSRDSKPSGSLTTPSERSSGGLSAGQVAAGAALTGAILLGLERLFGEPASSSRDVPSSVNPPAAPTDIFEPQPAPSTSRLPSISGKVFASPSDFDFFHSGEPRLSRYLYIFHGPDFPDVGMNWVRAEYYARSGHLLLLAGDGRRYDVGAQVQVGDLRKRILETNQLYIVQTKNGQAIKGFELEVRIFH